ncbi:nucleotidyl transferase AbiEii/AbiGii toxin family protein [Tamlana sp. I1]|uniref:nucleotidyl transferase AbiEii/AbiGii toxin family protein n=1 Tax=Tamlana sp. I1 TaxID=2762061 RepID=UPI00188E3FDC|nr:nucleotidyl transferase AbiEii/AbiGii toxin family protein [Tamlana sp. I1]
MLHYNTVNDLLKKVLTLLMSAKEFESFRLVGGTALSLQIGHRESIDIDLFSDLPYGTIDFDVIQSFLEYNFAYVDHLKVVPVALGKSYFIGTDSENTIKLDVFYTDPFIQLPLIEDGVRMATLEEISAMKLDVIQRGGRKKDFWDLHELFNFYSLNIMLDLHKQRYPHTHEHKLILKNLIEFENADDDFDPICFLGKHWEFIKEDITDILNIYIKNKT